MLTLTIVELLSRELLNGPGRAGGARTGDDSPSKDFELGLSPGAQYELGTYLASRSHPPRLSSCFHQSHNRLCDRAGRVGSDDVLALSNERYGEPLDQGQLVDRVNEPEGRREPSRTASGLQD